MSFIKISSLQYVQDEQKNRRINLRRFKKQPLSAAIVQKSLEKSTRLQNDLKSHENRMLIISYEKTFTVDPVFNKQTNRVVAFGNDVSEQRRVSTTKHSASIIILGAVVSNGKKMTPVWLERRQSSRKVFHGLDRLLKNQIMSSNRTERRHIHGKECAGLIER